MSALKVEQPSKRRKQSSGKIKAQATSNQSSLKRAKAIRRSLRQVERQIVKYDRANTQLLRVQQLNQQLMAEVNEKPSLRSGSETPAPTDPATQDSQPSLTSGGSDSASASATKPSIAWSAGPTTTDPISTSIPTASLTSTKRRSKRSAVAVGEQASSSVSASSHLEDET